MNHNNLILVLFGLSISFIYQNVEARLEGESIIGGQVARKDQFQYQVAILIDDFDVCGGGIIGNKYVLTAAHCVIDQYGNIIKKQPEVLAGSRRSNTKARSAVRVKVKKIYVPREYDPNKAVADGAYPFTGDIAVLKLKTGLGLRRNPKLRALRLPVSTYNNCLDYVGEKAIVAGYGVNWLSTSRDSISNASIIIDGGSDHKLRFAEATVLSNEACANIALDTSHDRRLCAAITQRDPQYPAGMCMGDSGSPLVYKGDTVIGVVSASSNGCREDQSATVYTRVSFYISFIENAEKDVMTDDVRVAKWT